MEAKIDEILERTKNIEKRLELLEKSATTMDEHIDFVENVYDIVKTPFAYVLGTYSSNSQNKLLTCTKNENENQDKLKTIGNDNNDNAN